MIEDRTARIARIRAQVRAGTYAPGTDAVAEAVLAWIAPPAVFEPPHRSAPSLDGAQADLHTAQDADPRR